MADMRGCIKRKLFSFPLPACISITMVYYLVHAVNKNAVRRYLYLFRCLCKTRRTQPGKRLIGNYFFMIYVSCRTGNPAMYCINTVLIPCGKCLTFRNIGGTICLKHISPCPMGLDSGCGSHFMAPFCHNPEKILYSQLRHSFMEIIPDFFRHPLYIPPKGINIRFKGISSSALKFFINLPRPVVAKNLQRITKKGIYCPLSQPFHQWCSSLFKEKPGRLPVIMVNHIPVSTS